MGVFVAKFILDANGHCEAWRRSLDGDKAFRIATFSNRGDAEAWLLGEVESVCIDYWDDCGGPLEVCGDGDTRCDIHAEIYATSEGGNHRHQYRETEAEITRRRLIEIEEESWADFCDKLGPHGVRKSECPRCTHCGEVKTFCCERCDP